MRTIITLALLAYLLFSMGGMTISFSPFSITFPHWLKVTGYLTLAIGVGVLIVDAEKRAFQEGVEQTADQFTEKINSGYHLIKKDVPVEQD